MTKDLIVRRLDDRSEVKRIPLPDYASPRLVERVMSGMLINMDTERFYIDDSAFDSTTGATTPDVTGEVNGAK